MVDLKEVSPGRFVVTAEYTSRAAALAAFIRITDGPIEKAFKPLPPALEGGPAIDSPEHHHGSLDEALGCGACNTPQPMIVPHAMAAAMQRDLPPADDDEGEPIPGYGCATGACNGD